MNKFQYAKFNSNGTLDYLRFVPNISNPTPGMVYDYAMANGYKEVVSSPQPNRFYTSKYVENDNTIEEVWTPIDLDSAKSSMMDEIQDNLNRKLSQRERLSCSLGYDIVYDIDACLNVLGMMAYGTWPSFVDADDNVHNLNAEEIGVIAQTLTNYRGSLYANAQEKRQLVQNATSVDELVDIFIY